MKPANASRAAELQSELGPRAAGSPFLATKRSSLRAWVAAMTGLPAVRIIPLGMAELSAIYQDSSDRLIDAWAKPSPAEEAIAANASFAAGMPSAPAAPPVSLENAADVGAAIALALQGLKVGATMDEGKVRAIAAEEAAKVRQPERLIVLDESKGTKIDVGVQHRAFPLLLKVAQAGLNAALVGPAGSGKTHAVAAMAQALGRRFELQGTCVTKSDITGFIDARGEYQSTPFSRSFTDGGVLLCDEMDGWGANPTLALNAALANGHTSLPKGMTERHADWVAVMSMNTYGAGASRQYVGRNQLDAATIDRLCFIDWDYDEALEGAMVGVTRPANPLDIAEGGAMSAAAWLSRVQALRAGVAAAKVRHLITPRASVGGLKLFAVGVGRKHVEEMVVWKGLDSEQRARVESAARSY